MVAAERGRRNMPLVTERSSGDRIFVASVVGAFASVLTQTVVERFVAALPARTIGAVVFTSVLIGAIKPRPTLSRAALALLGAVALAYLLERFV